MSQQGMSQSEGSRRAIFENVMRSTSEVKEPALMKNMKEPGLAGMKILTDAGKKTRKDTGGSRDTHRCRYKSNVKV